MLGNLIDSNCKTVIEVATTKCLLKLLRILESLESEVNIWGTLFSSFQAYFSMSYTEFVSLFKFMYLKIVELPVEFTVQ